MRKTGPSINRGSSRQTYGTPRCFTDAVESNVGELVIDLAADRYNAKAPLYLDEETNSLAQDWSQWKRRGVFWLNPPFDNIAVWAAKCLREANKGCRIAFLVPASVGSNWYAESVDSKTTTLFLNGRITFAGEVQPYPKDCMLVLYGFDLPMGTFVWSWQKNTAFPDFEKKLKERGQAVVRRRKRALNLRA